MRKENENRKRNNKTGMICMLVLLLTGISACGIGGGTQKWKEEVKLSDGRVIVVDRVMLREGGGGEWASNRSLSKPKEYQIRFTNPDGSGKMIDWRSTKKDDRMYPELPLILDLEARQPIIYSIVYFKDCCENYNKYVYRNGVWIEEKLPETFEILTTNLLLKHGVDMPKYFDLKTKNELNADLGYRQSIRQVGPNRKVCG